MESIYKNDTWELVKLPDEKKVICCKWVFKGKKWSLGVEKAKYRARLVVQVHNQFLGIDFINVFLSICKIELHLSFTWHSGIT